METYVNQNPAFYVNEPKDVSLVYTYGWYAVFTLGKLSILDRRGEYFGNIYRTTNQLIEQGGITTDKELYDLLGDGLLTQLKSPFFVVWEIGKEKPFDEKYFSIQYACQKAHSMAVSEPAQRVITKEKTIA